jgi:hypothetical protein
MTTKTLFVVIQLFFVSLIHAQTAVNWLVEESLTDSLSVRDLSFHTCLKPYFRQKVNLKRQIQLSEKIGLLPLTDIGGQYDIGRNLNYRAGLGFALETEPFKKSYLRVGALGMYGNFNLPFEPYYLNELTQNVYLQPTARFSYTPNSIFNFQIGMDENFIGEGSRSLLLGDYGRSYPFGQINANFWRIQYTLLYQFMQERFQDKNRGKFMASHLLSWNATKNLNFNVFESVVFQPRDTLLYRGFEVEYLNPIVFFRPQEYAIGSSDNVLIGAGFNFHWKKQMIYGQGVLDEFLLSAFRERNGWWGNKFGAQLGWKGKHDFGALPLFYRVEANFVRPFTYAHLNAMANYGNRGASIAHPLGANFAEVLIEGKTKIKELNIQLFLSGGWQGFDKDNKSYGGNIYRPYTQRPGDLGYTIGFGEKNNFVRGVIHVSKCILREGNIHAFGEIQFRYNSSTLLNKFSVLPSIGLRSNLWNDYRNF